MQSIFVLFVTVFFYHQEPAFVALKAPSADACVAGAPKVKAMFEAKPDVKSAEVACFEVKEGDKS